MSGQILSIIYFYIHWHQDVNFLRTSLQTIGKIYLTWKPLETDECHRMKTYVL